MTAPVILNVRDVTPKKKMAQLRKLAKEKGRDSPEYKALFDEISKDMEKAMRATGQ